MLVNTLVKWKSYMKIVLLLLLILTIVSIITSRNTLTNNNAEDFKILLSEALDSLSKLLNYMQEPSSVVGDLTFGIVLSAAQLSILKKHLRMNDIGREIINPALISELEQKCTNIYTKFMTVKTDSNRSDYDTIISNIVRQDLWEVDYAIVYGNLKKPSKLRMQLGRLSNLSKMSSGALLMTGTPKELESDECLAELVKPTLCGLSEKCEDIMTNKRKVHGYPLTHRLLFFQTAKRLGCGNYSKFGDIQKQIVNLCSNILLENYNLIKMGRPSAFRDLFLEQISLCGMEGFAEFLNPYNIKWVMQQQTADGCFTEDKENLLEVETEKQQHHHHRVKREDGKLGDNGCTMHITGMAAIFLSLNIRALVEYWSLVLGLQ